VSSKNFKPLVIPVQPKEGEMLASFLTRATETNHLRSPSEWLAHYGIATHRALSGKVDRYLLKNILKIESDNIKHLDISENKSHTRIFKQDIPLKYIDKSSKYFCPLCAKENGYVDKFGLIRNVSICPIHEIKLINKCSTCSVSLTWNRSEITKCKHGHDLVNQQYSKSTSKSEIGLHHLIWCKLNNYSVDKNLLAKNGLPNELLEYDICTILNLLNKMTLRLRKINKNFSKRECIKKISFALSDWPKNFIYYLISTSYKNKQPFLVSNFDDCQRIRKTMQITHNGYKRYAFYDGFKYYQMFLTKLELMVSNNIKEAYFIDCNYYDRLFNFQNIHILDDNSVRIYNPEPFITPPKNLIRFNLDEIDGNQVFLQIINSKKLEYINREYSIPKSIITNLKKNSLFRKKNKKDVKFNFDKECKSFLGGLKRCHDIEKNIISIQDLMINPTLNNNIKTYLLINILNYQFKIVGYQNRKTLGNVLLLTDEINIWLADFLNMPQFCANHSLNIDACYDQSYNSTYGLGRSSIFENLSIRYENRLIKP